MEEISIKQQPHTEAAPRRMTRWELLLTLLLSEAMLFVLLDPLQDAGAAEHGGLTLPMTLLLLLAASYVQSPPHRRLLQSFPWIVSVLLLSPLRCLQGLLFYINLFLSRWNTLHDAGLPLLSAAESDISPWAATVLLSLFSAYLSWWAVRGRRRRTLLLFGLLLLWLQLAFDRQLPWVSSLFSASFLGLCLLDADGRLPRRSLAFLLSGTAFLLALTWPLSTEEWTAVTALRTTLRQELHTLRYGRAMLPAGDLQKEAALHAEGGTLLRVQTEQAKTLYLRGFVGSAYQDGQWSALPGSAYGGSYTGLLSYLRSQSFDPLTQTAQYYALSEDAEAPEENHLLIQVLHASRDYLYLPGTANRIGLQHTKELQDQRITATELFGSSAYTVAEQSSRKPSELTMRAGWLAAPTTEEQQRYVAAEALYRDFVYASYTSVPLSLQPLLQSMFGWSDARRDESVYNALDRVRQVLRNRTRYAEAPEMSAESDVLEAFLRGEHPGNAMLYATAAAMALRLQGIPTRYVEGYRLSAEDALPAAGVIEVTGQQAHAWIEIYYDGIGWLPVDVTPGYYYDAVTLQSMVSLPDSAEKTAVLPADVQDPAAESEADLPRIPDAGELAAHTLLLFRGILAFLVVLLVLLFLLLELFRLLSEQRFRRRFRRAAPMEQVRMTAERIRRILLLYGINNPLGFHTKQADDLLTARHPMIKSREYQRVSALLEKALYGELPLEEYELRTLRIFLGKLMETGHPVVSRRYWKLRYGMIFG